MNRTIIFFMLSAFLAPFTYAGNVIGTAVTDSVTLLFTDISVSGLDLTVKSEAFASSVPAKTVLVDGTVTGNAMVALALNAGGSPSQEFTVSNSEGSNPINVKFSLSSDDSDSPWAVESGYAISPSFSATSSKDFHILTADDTTNAQGRYSISVSTIAYVP